VKRTIITTILATAILTSCGREDAKTSIEVISVWDKKEGMLIDIEGESGEEKSFVCNKNSTHERNLGDNVYRAFRDAAELNRVAFKNFITLFGQFKDECGGIPDSFKNEQEVAYCDSLKTEYEGVPQYNVILGFPKGKKIACSRIKDIRTVRERSGEAK